MSDRINTVMERTKRVIERDILPMWKPGAKVTVIVRNSTPEEDFLLTTDNSLDEIAALIERSKSRPDYQPR